MKLYPSPEKPYGTSLIVPYLLSQLEHASSNFAYDDEGFLRFPTRKGFNKILFSKEGAPDFLQGRSALEAAAFLQEWLFVGFLSDVCNVQNLKSQFLSDTAGRTTISIDVLGSHITAWRKRIGRLNDNERDIEGQRIDEIFQEFTELVNYCLTDTGSARSMCPLSQYPVISNNIILVADILAHLKGPLFPKSRPFKLGMSALISTHMRELREHGGWCPTDISMVNAQFSANAAYFAMRLGPSPSGRDHSACTADECRWHNLPDYEPRHSADCDCSDRSKGASVNFPAEHIGPFLGDGIFPLATVHRIDKTCEIRMQSARNSVTSYKRFVAVSHVFADGLGNEHENALPSCQLKRLQGLVDALYNDKPDRPESPLPFWFDTFCIPQGLSEKQVKKNAITDVATVYSSADRVLILDADLLLFDAQPAIQHNNYNEVFMRIKLSPWMRRLWTLQEALLGSDLWFQFKDGPLRFRDLRNTFVSLIDSDIWSPIDVVYPTAIFALDRIIQFPRPKGNESPHERDSIKRRQINSVHNLLHYRSTKRREDEAFLLGSIMLLSKNDQLKIQQPEEGHLRLQQYINILGCSREIIFSRGQRMPEDGWRWAPMTFIPIYLKSQLHINEQAKIEEMDLTGEGLLVRGSRFEIQLDDRELPHPLMLAASGLTKYVVYNLPGPPPPVSSWDALKLHEVEKLGLLLNNPIPEGSRQMELAVLVDLQASGIGIINTGNGIPVAKVKARYVRRVIVQRYHVDEPTVRFWQTSEVPDGEWWILC